AARPTRSARCAARAMRWMTASAAPPPELPRFSPSNAASWSGPSWEIAMDDQAVRAALQRHWDASDASDFNAEHEIYREDAVLDYPQSGERIRGRRNIQESRFVQPNKK